MFSGCDPTLKGRDKIPERVKVAKTQCRWNPYSVSLIYFLCVRIKNIFLLVMIVYLFPYVQDEESVNYKWISVYIRRNNWRISVLLQPSDPSIFCPENSTLFSAIKQNQSDLVIVLCTVLCHYGSVWTVLTWSVHSKLIFSLPLCIRFPLNGFKPSFVKNP